MKPELAYFPCVVQCSASAWLSCKQTVLLVIHQRRVCLQDSTATSRALLAVMQHWQWDTQLIKASHSNTVDGAGGGELSLYSDLSFSVLYAISVSCHRFLTCLVLKTTTTEEYWTTKKSQQHVFYPPINYVHSYSIMTLIIIIMLYPLKKDTLGEKARM